MKREYSIIIEKDSDGFYNGTVAELKGCHSQAKSLDELMVKMKEVIMLYEDVVGKKKKRTKFVGIKIMTLG